MFKAVQDGDQVLIEREMEYRFILALLAEQRASRRSTPAMPRGTFREATIVPTTGDTLLKEEEGARGIPQEHKANINNDTRILAMYPTDPQGK